jgi:hypothetical protein
MSIRRPSNASNSVTAPRSPMSGVAPSTSTIGSRRRASCNGVTLVRVRLLPNPQCVQLGLKGGPVDYLRGSKFISHEVCHRSLRQRLGRCLFSCGPLDLTVSGDMLRYRLSFPRGGEIKVHHDLLVAMLRAHGEALARLLREKSRCSKAAKWSPFFSWPSPLRRAFARRLLEGR